MLLLKKIFPIVLLSFFAIPVFAQNQSVVSGKVTDASTGAPVEGAAVKLKSSGKGVLSDKSGNFILNATATDVLEINALGYSAENVKVNGQGQINIKLQPNATQLGDVVVVGSRSGGRIKTETTVPVDVIKIGQATMPTGRMDLTSILNYAAPSFNYNKQSGSDGADHLDLATLRGLNPDQTLVLINGKRRHQTAFVAVFGTKGRGASGTDLDAIPISAIDHVEILRDGASAQYGSDAIAGVLNIVLKKTTGHLSGDVGWSGYDDHTYNPYYNTALHNQYIYSGPIDGQTGAVNLNYGLPVGKDGGYLNISGNFISQGKTFRQVLDTSSVESVLQADPNSEPINPYRRANGDGSENAFGIMYNLEVPIANSSTKFYSFGGFNEKYSDAFAFTRYASSQTQKFPVDASGNIIFVPSIMNVNPLVGGGNDTTYNPHIQAHIQDVAVAGGFKGVFGNGWNWDVSNNFGRNDFHYYGDQTFNASLGTSQTHFDDGGFDLLQNTTDFDISKKIKGVAEGLNLAFGAENRFENYNIYEGEKSSYAEYDPTGTQLRGAQGYPGYQPSNAVSASRNVDGLYAEAELDVSKAWLVDGAVRAENYTDFGFTSNYKFATRYKVTSNFNIRGSISTGFRAPSLPQIYFSDVYYNVTGGGASAYVQIAPNTSPLAQALGLPALKQEKSVNSSLGFSWKPMNQLTITVDGYYVKMTNRIVLSGIFDTSIAAIEQYHLQNPYITAAQFFTNAVNTSNYGVDVVFDYKINLRHKQHFNILLAANFQNCVIDNINVPAAFNGSVLDQELFYSPREESLLKATAPPQKISLNLEYGFDKIAFGTRLTYFEQVAIFGQGNANYAPPYGVAPIPTDDGTGAVPDLYTYHGKATTDVYVSYHFSKSYTLFVGADNLFNVHPDLGIVQVAKFNDVGDTESGGPFDAVQMGQNGMRLYARIGFNF